MSNDRHDIARLAAETARTAVLTTPATPAQAANTVVRAYRKAIADLSKPIKVKEQE